MKNLRERALFAVPLGIVTAVSACWPGWSSLLDPIPSREHRVEDLRVLAVELEPASLTIPAALAYGGEDGVVELRIRPRVFDPRGGELELGVALCATIEKYLPCTTPGIQLVQRTVRADASAPLGPVDVEVTARLDRAQLRALFADVDTAFPSLLPVTLLVSVSVAREVDGFTERELAVLPMQVRVDPLGAGIPDEDLLAASLVRCASLDDDRLCVAGAGVGTCGDGELNPAESCDPPALDLCSEECQSLAFCAQRAPLVCARAAEPNTRPRLVGLSRGDQITLDATPDFAPGARIPAGRGERLLLAPVFASSDFQRLPAVLTNGGGVQFDQETGEPLEGAPCPATRGFGCPVDEVLGTRYYIADGDAEIVSPDDGSGTGTFAGNTNPNAFGIAIQLGDEAVEEPLVVVVSDENGGMHAATFIIDVQ